MASQSRIRRNQLIRQAEGYLELGMAQQAIEALDRLDDPGTFRGHVNYLRGEAHRELEQYDQALEYLSTAALLIPSNIHVRLAQAWCLKRTGKLHQAIAALLEVVEWEEQAILHYNLACYFSLAGDRSDCLEHLARAFELDPSFRDLVSEESDFDPIRRDPQFLELTSIIV